MKILFGFLVLASLLAMGWAWVWFDITSMLAADLHYHQYWVELAGRIGNAEAEEVTTHSSRMVTAVARRLVRLVAVPLVALNLAWMLFSFFALRAASRRPTEPIRQGP